MPTCAREGVSTLGKLPFRGWSDERGKERRGLAYPWISQPCLRMRMRMWMWKRRWLSSSFLGIVPSSSTAPKSLCLFIFLSFLSKYIKSRRRNGPNVAKRSIESKLHLFTFITFFDSFVQPPDKLLPLWSHSEIDCKVRTDGLTKLEQLSSNSGEYIGTGTITTIPFRLSQNLIYPLKVFVRSSVCRATIGKRTRFLQVCPGETSFGGFVERPRGSEGGEVRLESLCDSMVVDTFRFFAKRTCDMAATSARNTSVTGAVETDATMRSGLLLIRWQCDWHDGQKNNVRPTSLVTVATSPRSTGPFSPHSPRTKYVISIMSQRVPGKSRTRVKSNNFYILKRSYAIFYPPRWSIRATFLLFSCHPNNLSIFLSAKWNRIELYDVITGMKIKRTSNQRWTLNRWTCRWCL